MKLEDELNFEKKQNSKQKKNRSSQKSSKSTKSDDKMATNVHLDSAFETASTVSSKINDNTLDYGDWAIMEPGNFGTERHFLDGFVSPQILPALQNGARPAMFRRESNYSTTSEEA